MKFTKFGKALLMSALSAGVVLGVTSCIQNYSIGYLYVTGTVTAGTSGNGIISGFKIDHNTGFLTPINGLPVSSGGANPVRAILIDGSRFLYVLNRGANKEGNGNCTTADPCLNSNITQFEVGANGILTAQQTFATQGSNPFRIISDLAGNYIYVLDHDSPDNYNQSSQDGCALALGGVVQTCGDITAFQVNQTTGRLSLVMNNQVTSTTGGGSSSLTYFPVPANPIDFMTNGSYFLVLSGTSTTGDSVFPYTYNSSSGQLTVSQNSSQPLNIKQGTAIVYGSGYVFVLDNEPITVNGVVSSQSQILPYTTIANGALQAAVSGPIPDDANQSNPIMLTVENKDKWFYVANQGNPSTPTLPLSGISGYVINSPFQPAEIAGTPLNFGTGGGPQCLVEDPSNQYFYTANSYDSTVSAQQINEQGGNLTPLSQTTKAPDQYSLTGPPTWCLVDGRIG
jgi:6-phosphogluconolactonase (cycloisomerase 2 family)